MFIRRCFSLLATTVLLMTVTPRANALQKGPPTDVDETPFTVGGLCAFPVQFILEGKSKTIELPGGRTIVTSPGLTATLTNVDNPENERVLNITGAFHTSVSENGDVKTVVTGRNLLDDPEAGFVLAIGTFSFIFDAAENLIQPLMGQGQLIDVCGLLS
jgi:hypothetical protein